MFLIRIKEKRLYFKVIILDRADLKSLYGKEEVLFQQFILLSEVSTT
jgi:hypothetical protein